MIRYLLALLALIATPALAQDKPPLVLAAASMQGSLDAMVDAWVKAGHARPTISYAASSALARQVEAGAPADLFVSADEDWMDELDKKGLLRPNTRADLLSNRIVLVVPVASTVRAIHNPAREILPALGRDGRLAIADPDSVPAGRYGKAALEKMHAWPLVRPRVVRAENVRAALALVERGAAAMGIVYATDAMASKQVRVVGMFPLSSHPPILYPVAILKSATSRDAPAFRGFLASPAAKAIFRHYGFGTK